MYVIATIYKILSVTEIEFPHRDGTNSHLIVRLSGYVYLLPQILSSQFCIANNTLIWCQRHKQIKTHLFLREFSQIYGSVSISFSGPFYPSRVVHITPKFWGNMDHPVGMYFSLHFVN